MARAGHDDCLAIGPPAIVLPALENFATDLWDRCRLRLQWTKTQIFTRDGVLPAGTPAGLTIAGDEVDGIFECGFDCYGIPIGTDKYVIRKLEEKAQEIAMDARKTVELLATDRQALWTALRLSISQRFHYFCQHSPPSLVEPVAAWLDEELWSV